MKSRFRLALLALFLSAPLLAQGGPQIYNMSLDDWHKSKGVWYPCSKDMASKPSVWDSGNAGLHMLGLSSVTPEYEHVAVPGEGKAAARIESKKVAWAFVAGNLFSGRFCKLIDMKGAETYLGTPFKARPKSLSGYYHYKPRKISSVQEPYEDLEGKTDEGLIEVLLVDWDKPRHQITHIDGFIDSDKDPHIIGRAQLIIKRATKDYVEFEIPFVYRNGKTPGYAVFTLTGSRFGNADTGAAGTVLYIDELKFNY